MDDWGDDWEEFPQSSKAGAKGSKTFDGLDDIVDDYDAQSSMPKTKRLKKAAVRKGKSKQADRKSTRLNSSHITRSRMPSSA